MLLSIIWGFAMHCQTEADFVFPTLDQNYNINEMAFAYVLGDSVNLRKCPSFDCDIIDTVSIGKPLILEQKSDHIDDFNGIKSHWYKIQSKNDTKWIFGTMLSRYSFGSQTDPSVKFVSGSTKQGVYQIRAFRNNVELDKIEFPFHQRYHNGISSLGASGLDLSDIIIFKLPCIGGCGCATGEFYIFWNNNVFSEVYEMLGTADAWASESKSFIFPTQMQGIPDTVIKVSSYYIDHEPEEHINRGIKKEYLKWDGEKLIPDTTKKTETKTFWTEE